MAAYVVFTLLAVVANGCSAVLHGTRPGAAVLDDAARCLSLGGLAVSGLSRRGGY
ncbi:hypothetical protein HDA40_001232 [Hamadaea flava]|uniref:Lipoprotein n=1 Tax=Hamadaea flava TaxID=1742688 RepID=A0ABV8LPI9_9ACTN|nr:hypothetical protein [Hamadaea flava]